MLSYNGPMPEISIDGFAERALNTWYDLKGLFAALLLATVLEIGFSSAVGFNALSAATLIVTSYIAVWVAWCLTRRPRKTKKDKIGFAVSLHCDKDLQTEMHDDFVTTLRRLITGGQSAESFDFLEMPPHIAAKTLDTPSAQKLRLKIRCHFLLYGRVRKRRIGNAIRYFLELDGIVSHREIPAEVQQQFKAEFSELLPRRLDIEDSASLFALDFTSRIADAVSKYIIGVAMALSGFLGESDAMLREAETLATAVTSRPPALDKIVDRVPETISAINLAQAGKHFAAWRDQGHDPAEITRMTASLAKVNHISPAVLTLRSIVRFISGRDTHGARQLLYQIPKTKRDATWEYNIGFLFAYDGNLKKARQCFVRGAQQRALLGKTISELELFMCWVVEIEPDRHQLHYALGLLNRHLKGDNTRAIQDFQVFLDRARPGKFDREQKLAKLWIDELR